MNDQAKQKAPPQTLDQLKNLLAKIQAADSPIRLGRRAFQVLGCMVDAPDQAAVSSISELAETLDVNASTLTRLAKKLGYSGFSELQNVFRRRVVEKGHFYSDQANRLLRADQGLRESLALAARVADDEIANISAMLKDIDVQALEKAADLLATARRVRTYGLRQFYSIACFISYALGLLRGEVAVLGSPQHGVAHALGQLERGDVLIVVGAYPYTRGTVAAARIAAAHGMSVIAITDSSASPLAAPATHTFITPVGGSFFSNSMASSLVLAEGLLTLVAQRLEDRGLEALKHREALISELNVEL